MSKNQITAREVKTLFPLSQILVQIALRAHLLKPARIMEVIHAQFVLIHFHFLNYCKMLI